MEYEKPELTDLGDLQELTAAQNVGTALDDAALTGQPVGFGNGTNP